MYQTNPPQPPQASLPTMDDLPSEDAGEPGLPDEFHDRLWLRWYDAAGNWILTPAAKLNKNVNAQSRNINGQNG